MRHIVVIFTIFLFAGCSLKPNVLTLRAYKPASLKISNTTSVQKAYIKSVIDTRENEARVGEIDNIANTYTLYTDTNMKLWIYNALAKALMEKGYEIVDEPLREALSIKVAITEFDINYNKAVTKYNNLKGVMDIQLSLKKGFKKKIENILLTHKSFHVNTPSKSELEYLMQTLMNNMATEILQKGVAL